MTEFRQDADQAAYALAAIRWYVISLEKLSNDIYVTDKAKYEQVLGVLKSAFKEMGGVRKSLAVAMEGCPPGYVNCNGACLPDCDQMLY